MASTTAIGWRERWALAENARRLAQHNDAVMRWEHDLAVLQWYRDLATSAATRPSTTVKELKLRKGEEVYWEAAGAQMIEVPDNLSLFAPVHSVYSPLRHAGGYLLLNHRPGSERDSGSVVVTNQRIFFDGAKSNREWAFAHLTGLAHGQSAPMSMLRVSNRQRLSGLVFDAAEGAAFQFFLGLALSVYQEDRAGFVAHLAQLESHVRGSRPPAPMPASPYEAPSRPATGLRRLIIGAPGASVWRQVLPSLVTVVIVMIVCQGLLSPPESTPSTSSAGLHSAVATTSSAPPPPVTLAPVVVAPAPTSSSPKPPPPTTTKPAESTCGAPANPWGYDFCSGGSTISNPPSDFCAYFDCIASFWENTNGYVMECKDHTFSHSGGRQGSCSQHGGNNRTLTT